MLIDSHTHLNFKAYNDDLEAVIDRCHKANMKLVNVGAALATSKKGVQLALENKDFYASVGLHPVHVFDEEFEISDYQSLIDEGGDKVVALGETGFDYFHLDELVAKGAKSVGDLRQRQETVFRQHIELAQKNNLALIIHGRHDPKKQSEYNAYQDIFGVIQDMQVSRAVAHCFGGNLEEAQSYVRAGYYIGFTGIVTFDKTGLLEQIVKWMPMEQILIETDAPYLTPIPYRGQRNEPAYVYHVAEKIAEWKQKSVEEIIEITGNNATRLFNLK